jgi:ribosomal protein L7/L12
MVEGVPSVVRTGLPREEAEALRNQLQAAGARVALTEGAPTPSDN